MRRAVPLALLLLAGCDLSMREQARGDAQGADTLWPGGPMRSAPPAGSVAVDQLARDAALDRPPPLSAALLDRGEARYGIYCAMCHGERGDGDGTVVKRGFPAPPSYREPRLMAASPAYVVDVITNGHGVMYSYADRVAPADRWAIAAYIKALQRIPAERSHR
ncbi:Cytochrome c, mono-and diheme variants [Sphingomonas gellani]|uniref:Cytochrome c, mono-and diheme variants n=1 Tax=Sphingomonas gellani TaxID=1166340 RepID=A0A1H7ZIH9_9SPHN|nr:cytochrome c [Sphingomonas gellani]SEM57299.1 Cytochrome c, mono-and diheme variants [Sphingomonas gellani]